jgi:hypothetical protein
MVSFEELLNAPAFVVHMEAAKSRKPFFMNSTTNAGFTDIRIFPAVNAYNPAELESAIAELGNPKIHPIKQGAIGCLASHLKLLLHIVQNKIPLATIFEDDVFFHPEWGTLGPRFLQNTPADFDVLFIGNQIDEALGGSTLPARINKCSTFCTHAYVVTLKGASKLLQLILQWDWKSDAANVVMSNGAKLTGLFCIDIIIKNIQMRILSGKLPKNTLIWYCWCGVHHTCQWNRRPLVGGDTRNTGLVFQCDSFPSVVNAYSCDTIA